MFPPSLQIHLYILTHSHSHSHTIPSFFFTMSPQPKLLLLVSLLIGVCGATTNEEVQTLDTKPSHFNPQVPPLRTLSSSKRFEGSSEFVKLKYHMGPVLSSPVNIYLIWYGKWPQSQKLLIKDFLLSISASDRRAAPSPSVADWWRTVSLYTDQTGANISRSVSIAGEYADLRYSHGSHLTRLSVQEVIATAVRAKPFPVDHRNGIYLILTAEDVTVEDFCRAVCGFHYFTFPSKVGYTLPYAWVGNSGKQCPEVCAYPFAGARVHGRRGAGTPRAAERRRRGRRHGERDRARAGGAVVEPARERVVRRGGPHRAHRDRGPLRGFVRNGWGWGLHRLRYEGRGRENLQS
ncbi:EXORDIUM 5 [Spatholobus suberectus]|nr:EXORDIUM 5 [Spatholobus suberectus]